ncbi:MAG: autotransporter-associated beta strand repeat-containing protein [Pirellulales bacterium]|nr:autotransporter-associated beta strand repeat-containing protein [Pirellulales bacterium]
MNQLFKVLSIFVFAGLVAVLPAQAANVYWTGTDGQPFGGGTWVPGTPVTDDYARICNDTWVDLSDPFTDTLGRLYLGGTFTETDLVTYPAGTYAGTGELRVSDDGSLSTTGHLYMGYDGYNGTLEVSGGSLSLGDTSHGLLVGYTTAAGALAATGTYHQTGGSVLIGYRTYVGYNNGDGVFTLDGGTFTCTSTFYTANNSASSGAVYINGGTLDALGSFTVGTGAAGTYDQTGGTVNIGTNMYIGHQKAGTGTMSGGVINYAGRFSIAHTDSGTSTFTMTGGTINKTSTAEYTSIGYGDNDTNYEVGTWNMSGDAVVNTVGTVYFGIYGGEAHLNMSTTGDTAPQFNVTDGSIMTYSGNATKSSVAEVNMGGHASMNLNSTEVRLGIWGYSQATWSLSGNAALNMTGDYMLLGDNWSGPGVASGTLNMSGNATATLTGAYISAGDRAFAQGTVNMGTLGVDNPTFTLTGSGKRLYLGRYSGTGVWNQNAGTADILAVVMAASVDSAAVGGSGTLNLNGGTFITTWIRTSGSLGVPATINFNGATLKAKADTTQFIYNGGSALMNLYVQAGGAIIDSDVYNITITESLQSDLAIVPPTLDGGLTKLGSGALSLEVGGTYTGPTLVQEGTLLAKGSLASNVTVSSGAAFGSNGYVPALTTQSSSKLVFGATDTMYLGAPPTVNATTTVECALPGTNPLVFPGDHTLMTWATVGGETNPVPSMGYMPTTDCFPGLDFSSLPAFFTSQLVYDTTTSPGLSMVKMTFPMITNEWQGSLDNNYDTTPDAQNWVNSGGTPYEPGADQQALFGLAGTSFTPVVNQAALSLGSLLFNNTTTYTLSGSTITLNTTLAEHPQIAVVQGSHIVQNPLTLNMDTEVNVYDPGGGYGYSLTLTGPIGGTGSLILGNGGKLVLTGANTYTGKTVMEDGSTLEIDSLGNVAVPNTLGQSTAAPENLVLNGTLHYTGPAAGSTDRGFTLSGNADISLDNPVTLTGQASSTSYTLTKKGAKLTYNNTLVNSLGAQFIVEGDLELTGTTGATYEVNGAARVGYTPGIPSSMTLSGDAVANFTHLDAGTNGGTGDVVLKDHAVLNVSDWNTFGDVGGTATLTMTEFSQYHGGWGRLGEINAYSTVTVNLYDDAVITYTGWYAPGAETSTCYYNLHDQASVSPGGMDFSYGQGGKAYVEMSGTSHFTPTGAFTLATHAVSANPSIGELTMTEGSYITANGVTLGHDYGQATVEMSGTASITSTGAIAIADYRGAHTVVTMTGNASLTSSSWLAVGNSYLLPDVGFNGYGEVFMSDNATLSVTNNELEIAWGGTGILHIGDGTVTDNVVVSSFLPVILGAGTESADTNARIDLNGGGTLVTPGINTVNDDTVPVSSILNLNGGTLQASADSPSFIANDGAATSFHVYVQTSGAKIDTDSHTVTVNALLEEDSGSPGGGLTKLSDGTLTLTVSPAYTGDTNVNAGTLTVPSLNTPSADVTVYDGATLNATSITAATLTIGGTPPPSAASAAAPVPEPSTLVLLALAGLGGFLAAWRRKR